ncbi:hypothetical protein [Lacipirellula limnantheis]|uniref:hypothetical protein n=1 Tax=Lacipirellula limnantheis TaxID=2528024 RepID=UPI0011A073FD|nr:hypothetical protein [Lacipirellula limnantheis]
MICFVESGVSSGVLPLVPVRLATVKDVRDYGGTLTIELCLKEFVFTRSEEFTQAVVTSTGGISPTMVEGGAVQGRFCFEVDRARVLPVASIGAQLTVWSTVVEQLQMSSAFKDEPYFWVLTGVVDLGANRTSSEELRKWPHYLSYSNQQAVEIYHYRPQKSQVPQGAISIEAGGPVVGTSPPTLEVDSRYDLKRWYFGTTEPSSKDQFGWFRFRTNQDWTLDLPVALKKSWWNYPLAVALCGSFIALPPITAYVTQHYHEITLNSIDAPHWGLIVNVGLSLASGLVAAAVVLASLPRLRP